LCALLPVLGCSAFDPDGGVLGGPGSCGSSGPAPNVGAWPAEAVSFEDRVLELTNQRRADGGCCGSSCFGPSRALGSDENLRAAARLHARDMAQHDLFSHDSFDGRTFVDRASAAGFGGCTLGENIAQGQQGPEQVVAGGMASEGHCTNMLLPSFSVLGVGFFDDPAEPLRRLWVQDFGG
jgi:uncharacterized protein YkwD